MTRSTAWPCACCRTCRARRWDRQGRSCLEGSLDSLDSHVTKRPCRTRTHRNHIQQEIIMTEPVAGIDPHQKTFTVGIVDEHGVEVRRRDLQEQRRRLRRRDRSVDHEPCPPGRHRRIGPLGCTRRRGAGCGRVRRPRSASIADCNTAPISATREDRRRRRSVGGARSTGRAEPWAGPGTGRLRPARRQDRGRARTPASTGRCHARCSSIMSAIRSRSCLPRSATN